MTAASMFLFAFLTAASVFADPLEIQSTASYSRLKLALDSSFNPKIIDTKKGFEIQIPAATLMDIGIPFGGETEFETQINKIKDSRLKNVQVKELSNSLLIKGEYVFPTGKDTLANPSMEHFEFRQQESGRWVVDFWFKKGPTVIARDQKEKSDEAKRKKNEEMELVRKENERKAARDKRLLESKSATSFCEQPVERNNTVFLKFRPDHAKLNFSSYFPEHIPDHRFEYTEPKGDSEEARMVRLALKLSRENKYALVVKTIDFFKKEYPKSIYLDEMKFLKASAFYRLGLEDQGREQISDLAKGARGTEAGLQAAAFIAVQSFRKEEWLTALEAFMNIKREFPKHALTWLFRYGIAECLYEIKQSEQAATEYEWIAKNAPKAAIRAEAMFKLGDINYDRNQFAQAIQAYSANIKKNPEAVSQYPAVVLNLAEAYFQLEEYPRAEREYAHYLDVGRTQPNAWRAHLRMAEIQNIHKPIDAETEKSYIDTINKYPMTPGAVVARMRLLPCGSHGGFDLASAERFFKSPEVARFETVSELYSSTFRELVSITEVRTLISFGQDQKAVDRAMDHLRENPSFDVRKLIEQAMIGGIKRLLDEQTKAGDFISALGTFEKYGDYLPLPNHDPMVDDLRLKLAKYASETKLTTLALKIIEPYRRMSDIQQKDLLAAIEKNLTLDSVVEQEERNYIEAKTRWNGGTFKVDDEKAANEFLALLGSIREISPHAWDRDLMKALFFQEKKDYGKAYDLAFKLTKKIAALKPGEQAQFWNWYGEAAKNADQPAEAIKGFHNSRLLVQKLSEKDRDELNFQHLPPTPAVTTLVYSEGEVMENQQKWKEAVALYSDAIENKIGGNHVLYAHARAILKEGGRDSKKLASRSLEKIQQSQDDDVWKSLAQKALDEIAKEGKNDQSTKP
ncbi:MAG: tetratricopeptide repeat protein [Bdellovibrionales bacterium]|nr:tetratricopeptide repeat protein [Bdellovibrionales bacterium]